MRVWVARAQPGADATAMRLRAMGHEPVVAPVLEVRPVPGAVIDLEGVDAVALTSANAVQAYAALEPSRDLPVFAVGEASAAAARAAGFAAVHSADGDLGALSALLETARPGTVLHAAATETAGDLAPTGVPVRTVAIYETVAARPAINLATLDAVLIHSPKAGRQVAEIAAGSGHLAVFALSPNCAAPVAAAGLGSVAVAARPNETALLTLLRA
jgi:uroporphyrinogen-III synthase